MLKIILCGTTAKDLNILHYHYRITLKNEDMFPAQSEPAWNELVNDLWTKRLHSLGDGSFGTLNSAVIKYGFSNALPLKENTLADDIESISCDERPLVTDDEGINFNRNFV